MRWLERTTGIEPAFSACAPMCLSSCSGGFGFVVGAVAEHREEHVAAAAGKRHDGLVVAFSLVTFAVVVGPRDGIFEGGKRREEQHAFEFLVAATRPLLGRGSRSRTAG